MVPINVAQIPSRLNDVSNAALELFGLGEALVCFAIPENGGLD